jgi:hypothetical protein
MIDRPFSFFNFLHIQCLRLLFHFPQAVPSCAPRATFAVRSQVKARVEKSRKQAVLF